MTRFAGSFKLLVFLILAACSQVQTPNTPTPQVPTVMSTDLSDGAMGVAADADGNAYVVGYRNASNFIGDIFVSRIDISGRLAWVTNLEKSVSVNYDYPYLKPVVTNDAVYVVVADQNDDFAFTLHKLAFDGTRLWSKKPFGPRGALGAIAATPDGKLLYISSHPYSNDEIVISALDGTGAIVWEVVAPDARRLEVASDGSLYETPDDIDYYRVSKRAADGTLEWTREFVPSVPFQEGVIENRMELYVAADGVYVVAYFLQPDVGTNMEITRFSAKGEKEWSQLVIPQGQKSPDCRDDWHCLDTLGVTSGGALYVTKGNVLIQLTATGERFETDALNWYEDAISDKVLTRAKLPKYGPSDVFYEVGITGFDEASMCDTYASVRPDCAHTDAYIQQFRLDELTYQDGSVAEIYANLIWSSR